MQTLRMGRADGKIIDIGRLTLIKTLLQGPHITLLLRIDHDCLRFVSFPTTDAPSWYVLCTDGYRIVGEPEANSVQMTERPAPLTLPAARVVRRRRSSLLSDQIVSWVVMLAFLVGMYWYAFSLPVPHR